MQDAKAVAAFFKFKDAFQPDIRICGGDIYDLRPLRRKCDEHERREGLKDDIDAGNSFLERYLPHYHILGNHEGRLWHLAERAEGILLEYANAAIADFEKRARAMRCKVLPYDKREGVLKLGDLSFVHGYASGVSAARTHAQVYGDVVFGHIHRPSQFTVPGHPKPHTGYSTGCLCKLDMGYDSAHIGSLAHRHGFAYGVVNERTGSFKVFSAEEMEGVWLMPSDLI